MLSTKEQYLAFEKVFKGHYNALANYAFTILKSRQDAEDVVQDVYLRVWQNNPDVITKPEIKFYLITAVRNNAISFLRKQAGKSFVDPDVVQLHQQPDEQPAAQSVDMESSVEKALSILPPQCLIIFKMSRFGKLTYQQIADELSLSVKTVENQMGKALRLMRDYARKHNVGVSILLFILGSLA